MTVEETKEAIAQTIALLVATEIVNHGHAAPGVAVQMAINVYVQDFLPVLALVNVKERGRGA